MLIPDVHSAYRARSQAVIELHRHQPVSRTLSKRESLLKVSKTSILLRKVSMETGFVASSLKVFGYQLIILVPLSISVAESQQNSNILYST